MTDIRKAPKNKLTDKQWMFVNYYIIEMNATQAAIRAGYSEKTAKQMGAENLAKPDIKEAIDEVRERLALAAQIDALWVLRELHRLYESAVDADNFPAAVLVLEKIGKHTDVLAFKEQVEVKVTSKSEFFDAILEKQNVLSLAN